MRKVERGGKEWDYIVVGGGSAGCVVAARLAEDQAASVLLLEAGSAARSPFIQIPNGIFFVKGSPTYHWLMETEADPTRCDRRETLTCGKGLGGGSAINGMVYVKGLAHDYEAWATAASDDWNAPAVNRYFEKADTALRPEPPPRPHLLSRFFMESAAAAGYAANSPDLLQTATGVMPCPTTAAGGWRQSTARAYLRSGPRRPNLEISPNSVAIRLIVERDAARGVVFDRKGRQQTAYAAREIILCCGAINTPRLLMLSGIGPADHLRQVGIRPFLDLPAVGQHLQDHPCVWISATVRQKSWNDLLTWRGFITSGFEWLVRRSGPAASGMCQATLFGSTKGQGPLPDYQMSFVPAGYVVTDHGVAFLQQSSLTTAVSLCRPKGRGAIYLRSANPHEAPRISYRLLDNEDDLKTLVAACRAVRTIHRSDPLAGVITAEVAPGHEVEGDEQWANYVRRASVNMCHPTGSCRMGATADAVVTPRLKVRGIDGLRIADASIMPAITSGNTNAPTIMIAEKAADLVKADNLGRQ